MTMTMTKTAAIKATRGIIGIHGRGTSWRLIGPYYMDQLRGPSTEVTATSYTAARIYAARWRTEIITALMGIRCDDTGYAIWQSDPADVLTLVDRAIAAHRAQVPARPLSDAEYQSSRRKQYTLAAPA